MQPPDGESEPGQVWPMLVVTCRRESHEMVADWLWQRGVVAIEERLPGEGSTSDVELWTSVGEDPMHVASDLGHLDGVVFVRRRDVDQSVANEWRRFAEPVRIDDEHRIVPAWHAGPARRGDVRIEPMDTFGLGNHPTTVGALRLLLGIAPRPRSLLDVGTGSGVLSVAMARWAKVKCTAFDVSESSPVVVAHNASMNDVTVEIVGGFGELSHSFEVTVANILAPVLRDIADDIVKTVVAGGSIVLSGMRSEQVDQVVDSYRGWVVAESVILDGWTSVVLREQNFVS